LVASDGGVFTFNTPFLGSLGGVHLNKPIVGLSPNPDGDGYTLVASDGGVFTFNTPFYGSLGGAPPATPVVGLGTTPDGLGYTLVDSAGQTFSFGDAFDFSSAANALGAEATQTALAQVGAPYLYGGSTPAGFDCSGLTMFAWASAGVSLPHNALAQQQAVTAITASQLQPGDLIFYNNGAGGAQPGHVALYIGNNQVVTADTTGTLVRVESTTWDGTIMGYGQPGPAPSAGS
jgi:cell wall-associated NlpC family hydrolase